MKNRKKHWMFELRKEQPESNTFFVSVRRETADIEAIMTDLAKAIVKELAEPGYRQLELFTDNERSQLMRNTQALQTRLRQIPAEIEAEQEVISGRFADPSPRLFQVAVTFLVLERLA